MASNNNKQLHVVMFPWLAFGHMMPFLELSKLIAEKGHKISFVSTPRNIDRLPKLPPHLESSIAMVKIPLPADTGLPENTEATMDIQPHQMFLLKKAMDGMEPQFTLFLDQTSPDWVIMDFCHHWVPQAAMKRGISTCFFSICSPWFVAFLGPADVLRDRTVSPPTVEDYMVKPEWITFETNVRYKRHEAKWALTLSEQNMSGVTDFERLAAVISGSDALIHRYCNEFEPRWVKLTETLHSRPVLLTGLMPPAVHDGDSDSDEVKSGAWVSIKEWLDGQKERSVIYVALGSEVTIGPSEIGELAHGLDQSGVSFFWVLRNPSGSDISKLPDGFEERVKGRGKVWKTWAPQQRILSHDSVGGFLTHCGWSSTIEGLAFGHPLVMLPFLIDQGLIARVMEENHVGVEVVRNEENGSFTRDSVADSVRLVMIESDGKKIRENTKRMSSIFGDRKLNDKNVEDIVRFLENHRGM